MKTLISKARAVLPERLKQDRQARHFTTNYKHWSGATVHGEMKFAPDFYINGKYWFAYDMNDKDTMILGTAPHPRTNWQWFWFHWHHGRLMRYDLFSVLVFCLRNYKRNKV